MVDGFFFSSHVNVSCFIYIVVLFLPAYLFLVSHSFHKLFWGTKNASKSSLHVLVSLCSDIFPTRPPQPPPPPHLQRSHAVLEIVVTRTDLNHYNRLVQSAKLALVDLAGSERASETNNVGRQLKDGANINR